MNKTKFMFKKKSVFLLCVGMLALSATDVMAQNNSTKINKAQKFVHKGAGNPYLPLWEHLPDGETSRL
ncbi:hypothetical protein ACFX5U_09040 [Sphingobacterium sp. SG20118]|uniref:hypothetical protein n=1 Tax=Sphingobacterium sp. SG20118 TaxID=3367156 RepID=UPI0037DFC22C